MLSNAAVPGLTEAQVSRDCRRWPSLAENGESQRAKAKPSTRSGGRSRVISLSLDGPNCKENLKRAADGGGQ